MEWLDTVARERAGTVVAAFGVLAALGGLVTVGVGAAVGNAAVVDAGWTVVILVGAAGMLLRAGYSMAMRKRQAAAAREIEARLAEVQDSVERVERVVGGGTVRPLPRRGDANG